ncbi:taurine catabolism dioxygenase, TauD/TfdA family [Azotobacter vinelandii CA]|uniref:Taurine catabolism dioxygenase, TauD/TfdA family n=2 Tax=Azotobacter vinelandii TaxID=354 RepID=C1DG67_AZOVD|nr:TauD/TfdA family dioxygenase [Azotobacter vinelandii]ACO78378.1 taurine catabolism dioxygenase, TauD/TfdA family [Azotobacter vinelandii DJ]AGK14014.1 taurine catabolism dioxygenase, TauD/TfdA family [Azotobacter vinelandii CA]AGK18843.1 taurine catabolism dioxygenase, TauD/TfdA family [Azotobacter vinelandii CA6]WKN24085.1 TauD/TfdA family dioxygenase [Azotobacter vinelandii]SFY20906.1 taurine dioxygenase [Azotobacter vinelandii]
MTTATLASKTETLEITPLEPTIGAEVSGVDLKKPLSPAQRDRLKALLLQYKVLFFRDQHLSREQQVAFARHFGELYVHPTSKQPDERFPEVHQIIASEARARYGDALRGRWHSDTSWLLEPTYGAVLRPLDLPPAGGDTIWADSGLVYRGLPDDVKARIDDLYVVHNFKPSLDAVGFDYPLVSHPLVRTHPETGEDVLFINFSMFPYILGWSPEESRELVDYLLKEFSTPEYHVRFKWREGSLAFWDNRSSLHYPVHNYGDYPRVMERVLIADDDIPHRLRKAARAG